MRKRLLKTSCIYSLILMGMFLIFTNSCNKDSTSSSNSIAYSDSLVYNDSIVYGSVTDFDGNIYKTLTVNITGDTQTWMASNLAVTHYSNGIAIPNVTDNTSWSNLTTGAYCNYNNSASLATVFGKLYNFYAVMDSRNLCPTGWHVATDSNWLQLTAYLTGNSIAGADLRETGTTHWTGPNDGTNSVGFTALPGGYRLQNGTFQNIGLSGEWWTSSLDTNTFIASNNGYDRYILYNSDSLNRVGIYPTVGMSVRCIKNN